MSTSRPSKPAGPPYRKGESDVKEKTATLEAVLDRLHDGQTILFGDWHGELAADEIIDGMVKKGIGNIRAIAVSAGRPDQGLGKLIAAKLVTSLVTTHIGMNPLAREQMFAGELDVEFCPMGTWAERVRCGGAGLGGCLTRTGIGTEEAKDNRRRRRVSAGKAPAGRRRPGQGHESRQGRQHFLPPQCAGDEQQYRPGG